MDSYRPPATPAQRNHHAAALAHAERHFTDPAMKAQDAAILRGISVRVMRESLSACGTSWREITSTLRMARAEKLLDETTYEVWAVARLCGYDSPPAFANAFAKCHNAAPRPGGASKRAAPRGRAARPVRSTNRHPGRRR
jgi:transcriptional regulator GlxA family with amidase domain